MTRPVWTPAYVALGSNLDDPPGQLRRACVELAGIPHTRFVTVSAFYRNPPFGVTGQPDFVNAVAGLLTQLPPRELLARLKAIEFLGRAGRPAREAIPHLEPLRDDASEEIAKEARQALERIQSDTGDSEDRPGS